MAITTCFQKTALYRMEDSCSHFSMVKLEKNQELLEGLLIPVSFSMNTVSPWTSQLTRQCFSFPLSEMGTQFLCWLTGSWPGLREKVGFRAWCKWLFQHKKGEIVLSLAVGGSFIYQTAGNKDSKTEGHFGSHCCCFPEAWLLPSWNESLGMRKSHQVIKFLSSWGSWRAARTSLPGMGQELQGKTTTSPSRESCPDLVFFIRAVNRQRHPGPEHRSAGAIPMLEARVALLFAQRVGRDANICRGLPTCLPVNCLR